MSNSCLTNIRNFILRFDLFAANPTLRVRGESSYETFWCGIVSLIMIGAFAGIFAGEVLNVLNKTEIQAVVNQDVQFLSFRMTQSRVSRSAISDLQWAWKNYSLQTCRDTSMWSFVSSRRGHNKTIFLKE